MKERTRSTVRPSSRAGWLLLAFLVSATGANQPYALFGQQEPGTGLIQSFEAAIYNKVNEERTKRRLPELTWASDIAEVARNHSEDMATNEYFAHINQEGETVDARLKKAGIVFAASAENLFASNDFTEIADESVKRWMKSPAHRDNLLNPFVTDTGVGIYKELIGNNYYITQVFIQRALKIIPTPSQMSHPEIDMIFDIIRTSINKSKQDFNYSTVRKRILKKLNDTGIPFKEDIYIEGFLKDIPVLSITTDLIADDGFIVKFTRNDPDSDLETYTRLVHPQGYSAAVLIGEVDGEVRFPLIKIKRSESE